jgi:tRNA threonylcarbamoyl adenosine modification protein YeaZ
VSEASRAAGGIRRPRYILAIDTSLGAASACLLGLDDATPVAAESMPMERGHADALLPLLDRLIARVDGGFKALDRVAVTIGPGSFTGIRVGVAAARALGLACRVPVVGVSTLSALAAPAIAAGVRPQIVAAIDAKHGNVYAQSFGPDGATMMEACHASVADVLHAVGPGPLRLVGSGAAMLAIEAWSRGLSADVDNHIAVPDIALVARLGALADPEHSHPKPFYLKPPDAKPQIRVDLSQSPAPVS